MVHSLHIGIVERRQARQHLEKERAQRPPIDSLSVTLVLENFGCQVLRSTAEGLSAALGTRSGDSALGQTEIGQSNVASLIQPEGNTV